ncbi:MATE family efflux transporter [Tepidimicrobium xylanilyticum]|uniref:Probable multidrug resistance protein NorM n=1 Tax=Tepidimicrobium xylanilyticum TaxID=1123352 RepID=A0A1H2ZKL9_9FIRM|nr:MATE family efflux transporter [Tepidimicrobium xylanilyticum]SDX17508.1 putative efflux protein, MATE family [Tepidimicrobium xylanilyticum]
MTEGKISKKIILFAFPIFLGRLFQQLYNVVDSLVVGNVLGKEALAAVSSTGSLIFLIVGFINGIFIGSSVLISQYFGADDKKKLSTAVHTTIAFGFIAGIIITIIGVGFTPLFLRLMGTPNDVFRDAVTYLRLYFAGGIGIVMYNACMGIFQAIGDSKRPLYYLIIASIVNVVLDLLFVAVYDFGIGGAAIATVISQFVSLILAFVKLTKVDSCYKIYIKSIKIDYNMLKSLIKIGFPTGIQNSVISFANVVVQTNINSFGSVAMAGSGSYSKLEGFSFLPITSFSLALTTFIGQNLGAKKYDRAKKGARFGIIVGVSLAEIIGIFIWIFAPKLIGFFSSDPEVIRYGVMQARTISFFYFLLALSHCISGILRGAGKTNVPMLVMLISWCLIRISYITIMVKIIADIRVVYWAYPLTWTISSIIFIIYYKKTNWMMPHKDSQLI